MRGNMGMSFLLIFAISISASGVIAFVLRAIFAGLRKRKMVEYFEAIQQVLGVLALFSVVALFIASFFR